MKEFAHINKGALAAMIVAVTTGLASLSAASPAKALNQFVGIGTGGPTGVYFIAGNAICRLLHKSARTYKSKLRCAAPTTGGSIYNIEAIRKGDLQLGVAQSDIQQHAFEGSGKFEGRKFDKLRALFSIHAEPFQILVSKDSNIHGWPDLMGKRVNIGNPDSGQRGTFEALMIAHDVDASFFGNVTELTSTEQTTALCDGNIDAYGYTVGVPNSSVAKATNSCGAHIMPLAGKVIDRLVADNPYYATSVIPKGTYETTTADIPTFGVMATLLASADLSDETVYEVVRAVFENIDEFRRLHPSFAKLDPKGMISKGLSVPLHPGAVKYYREKGWIE